MSKARIYLKTALFYIVTLAAFIGIFIVPVTISLKNNDFFNMIKLPLLIVGIVFFVASATLSLVYYIIMHKRVNIEKQGESIDNTYDYARKNLNKYHKKAKLIAFWLRIYIVFAMIISLTTTLSLCMYASQPADDAEPLLYFLAFVVFLLFTSTVLNFFKNNTEYPGGYLLDDVAASFICGLLQVSASKLNITGTFKIYMTPDCNLSVYKSKEAINIIMGVPILQMLNKNEMESALFHELAHVSHQDIHRSRSLGRLSRFLGMCGGADAWWGFMSNVAYYWAGIFFLKYFEIYNYCTCLDSEIAADATVKEIGDKRAFVSACYKLEIYDIFSSHLRKYNIYEVPTQSKTFFADNFKIFLREYEQNKEKWDVQIENTLPMRLPTHPSYLERRNFFGADTFTVDFKGDFEWNKTRAQLMTILEESYYKETLPYYNESRKTEYLDYLTSVETYEKMEENKKAALDASETVTFGISYFLLTRYKEAFAIFEKVLADDEKNAVASFYKGMLMLDAYNNSGIDLLKTAAENNNNMIDTVTNELTTYVLRQGDPQLKAEIREWAIKLTQKQIDYDYNYYRIRRSDKIVNFKLDEKITGELVDFIKQFNCINEVKAITKISKDGFEVHAIGLIFNKVAVFDDKNNAYTKISKVLDARNEEFQLIDLCIPNIAAIFKRAKNNTIYKR